VESKHVYRPAAFSKVPHKFRIGLALRGSISLQRIRRDLALARAYGLDPRQLYAECIEEILAGKGRANTFPQYTDVDPNQLMLT
jgi:hypothetical protein